MSYCYLCGRYGKRGNPRLNEVPPRRRCGAKTRSGTPCKHWAMKNGRCRLHGGMSTGAKTPSGKARAIAALREGWERWNTERQARKDQEELAALSS